MESLDQCLRLEVREKARWWASTSVWAQGFTQHRIFIKFFSMSLGFSRLFRSYFVLQIFGVLRNLSKTIISSAFVGYDNGYSQLGDTRLVGYLPPHIQRPTRAHGIIVKYTITAKPIKSLELHYPMIQFFIRIILIVWTFPWELKHAITRDEDPKLLTYCKPPAIAICGHI